MRDTQAAPLAGGLDSTKRTREVSLSSSVYVLPDHPNRIIHATTSSTAFGEIISEKTSQTSRRSVVVVMASRKPLL
jgi:hypothetical protein